MCPHTARGPALSPGNEVLKGRYGIGWMFIGWLAIVAVMVLAIYMLTPSPEARAEL